MLTMKERRWSPSSYRCFQLAANVVNCITPWKSIFCTSRVRSPKSGCPPAGLQEARPMRLEDVPPPESGTIVISDSSESEKQVSSRATCTMQNKSRFLLTVPIPKHH